MVVSEQAKPELLGDLVYAVGMFLNFWGQYLVAFSFMIGLWTSQGSCSVASVLSMFGT